jgi:2,4-diketo-3-deoxy-L-fuconate hydrolase
MKLLRYGPPGQEKPGVLDDDGAIRDLSSTIPDFTPATVTPLSLQQIAQLDPSSLPTVTGRPRIGVPVKGIEKFIAIGLNYADHAAEANLPIPAEPPLFTKAISCLSGPNDDVMLRKDSTKADWEVELGVIIGKTTRYVSEEQEWRDLGDARP